MYTHAQLTEHIQIAHKLYITRRRSLRRKDDSLRNTLRSLASYLYDDPALYFNAVPIIDYNFPSNFQVISSYAEKSIIQVNNCVKIITMKSSATAFTEFIEICKC